MKFNNMHFNKIGFILLIITVVCCKNIDFKPSYLSYNINESKSRGVFICEYKIDTVDLANKIGFNYNEIWVEKRWSSYLDESRNEKFKIYDNTSQLVINFKNDRLFSEDIYWGKFTVRDDKDETLGSDKGLLFLDSDTLKKQPDVLKLFIYKVKDKYKPNLDTVRMGELVLSKKR